VRRLSPLAWTAWALFGVTLVLAVLQTWMYLGWSAVREDASSWPVLTVGLTLWAALGAVIVTRHPRHPVGWLFVVGATVSTVGNCLFNYDAIATSGPSPDPSAIWPWAVWFAILLDAPVPLLFLTLLFLLFPTGHLPSRRWRPLLWATWASFAGVVVALAVVVPPWQIEPENREDIFAEGWGAALIAVVLFVSLLLELLAAAASVVVRMRRARGVERQQLRWLAVTSSMVAVSFVFAAFLPWQEGLLGWVRVLPLQLSVVAVGAGAALAILRYRLYDLDVVVSRAILLTASTLVVAAGYTLLVVLVGETLPAVSDAFWPSLLATAAVALAFQPLRSRIVRFADRMVFGRRAAPYEALADFGRDLAKAPAVDDLLRNVAQAVAEATSAREVRAVLELPDGEETVASWPSAGHRPGEAAQLFVVTDRQERLGRVEVVMPPGRPLRPPEHQLVERLLQQSALAIRNLRLETELAADVAVLDRQTAALIESRRHLVRARDEEKARFAAALRRSVLPHLAPLPDRLEATSAAVTHDGGAPVDLQEERDAAGAALDELRRLVRGSRSAAAQGAAADQAASSRSGPNADFVT
jgi:hypothetical protein